MSITPEERAHFHTRLDILLDLKDKVEKHGELLNTDEPTKWTKTQFSNFLDAWCLVEGSIRFSGGLCSDNAKNCISPVLFRRDAEEKRQSLVIWLQTLSGFFQKNNNEKLEQGILIDQLAEGLSALISGETPVLLRAARVSGLPKNAFTRAKHQLLALCWVKHLIATGKKPHIAHSTVSKAYGKNWDTIKKWEKSCERAFGTTADSFFSNAEDLEKDFLPEKVLNIPNPENPLTLEECGQMYQGFISSPEKT